MLPSVMVIADMTPTMAGQGIPATALGMPPRRPEGVESAP